MMTWNIGPGTKRTSMAVAMAHKKIHGANPAKHSEVTKADG
jgi:hypothetical protein